MSDDIVKYESYDEADAKAEKEVWDKNPFGEFFKFVEGITTLRVLPALAGRGYGPKKKSPFLVVWQHFISTGSFEWSFACPRLEAKKRCPGCEKLEKLRRTGNPADYERAKDYLPKRRTFVNAINRNKPEDGPIIAPIGKTIHEALTKIRELEGDFTDPQKGYDISIERTGTTKNDTEYKVFPARKDSPLGNLAWIEQQHDLSRFGVVMEYEDIVEYVRTQGKGAAGQADAKAKRLSDCGSSEPRGRDAEANFGVEEPARPNGRSERQTRTVEADVVDGEVVPPNEDVPFL